MSRDRQHSFWHVRDARKLEEINMSGECMAASFLLEAEKIDLKVSAICRPCPR